VIKGDIIYVLLNCEFIYNANLNNRELVIIVAIVNYSKRRVFTYIIIKRAYHLRGHFLLTLNSSIEFS
jgi:hypothetical protein